MREALSRTSGAMRIVASLTMLAVLAVASGCKEQALSRVTEREANEMVATLYLSGIKADKVARDEKSWAVEVDRDDIQRALLVLQEHGLPRETFASTGELFKKEGLVSTPSEERIRYMYAVSQELSRTLSSIDGVITARVHLVMPANDPLATRARPASASVFIKHRADANLQAMSPAIKNLVMRGIEGLDYENIALTFVAGDEPVRRVAAAPASPASAASNASAPSSMSSSAASLAGDFDAASAAITVTAAFALLATAWWLARRYGRGAMRAEHAIDRRTAWTDAPSMTWLSRVLAKRRDAGAASRATAKPGPTHRAESHAVETTAANESA